MKAVLLMVHGRVQGVWFRAGTQEMAVSLGVSGWVRNTSQGNVEVWAQGMDADVDRLIAWCHHGPAGARVDQVEIKPRIPDSNVQGFGIRYR